MKVTTHVDYLLRQGRSPKELVELGFRKSVVTRVRRQLREEKTALQPKTSKRMLKANSQSQPSTTLPMEVAQIEQKVALSGEPDWRTGHPGRGSGGNRRGLGGSRGHRIAPQRHSHPRPQAQFYMRLRCIGLRRAADSVHQMRERNLARLVPRAVISHFGQP